MNEFAQYYLEFMRQVWEQICNFFVGLYNCFADVLVLNHIDNIKLIGKYANSFNVLSWILFVIVDGITLAFIVLLFVKAFQLLRRWLKFRKKEVEKEDLLFEIAQLKEEVKRTIKDKERILNLQLGEVREQGLLVPSKGMIMQEDATGGYYPSDELVSVSPQSFLPSDMKSEKEVTSSSATEEKGRFSKLALVDQKYAESGIYHITMTEDDLVGLPEIINRFVNYAASQHHLYYTKRTISKFVAGLATSKIIILEGISGTGKTSLPYAFSRFMKNQAQIVSVQPSWRDRTEILGYLNEFTKKFNETDFLKALYEVSYREDVNLIVLDELNLARIEYYFAEFLSIMEMPDKSEWKIDLVPTQEPNDPHHLTEGKLLIPQNLWYIGTANKDDSTFTITDKVYDRAVTLYLNERAKYFDAPFTESINLSYDYLQKLFDEASELHTISLKNLDNIEKLDEFVQENFKIAFGNRIMKQIKTFVPVYVACGNSELDGLDYMICTKIFKKFEALNLPFLKKELEGLIALIQKLYGKESFKESIAYLRDLLKMAS